MVKYQHAQTGYLIIIVITAALITIGAVMASQGAHWIAILVTAILAVVLVQYASLTVTIQEDQLEIKFGPGLIRKRYHLSDIESCTAVRNEWYYGWGTRLTPHGWLYNVSGLDAVEITFRTGSKIRVGTDAPHELVQAIRQAINLK